MRSLRKLLLGSAAAALAITALAAPAGAADTSGTIAIVNGHPGQRIDVCIGSKEQASGLAYGAYFHKKVIGTGPKLLRFFKKNGSKTCGGTLIAKKWVNIDAGWDKTVVITKKNPKVLVFDNIDPTFLGEIPPLGTPSTSSWHAQRHAAEFDVDMQLHYWTEAGTYDIFPSAVGSWTKGDHREAGAAPGYIWAVEPRLPGVVDPFLTKVKLYQESLRYEWILVGTDPGNAKLVVVKRRASEAT